MSNDDDTKLVPMPYYERAAYYQGDCRDALRQMMYAGGSVSAGLIDAVLTDPPYGIEYQDRKWDSPTGAAFCVETWKLAYEALKPGGFLLAFSSPRTYDLLASTIRKADFEIRDMLTWVNSHKMPHGEHLHCCHEPIVLARKPFAGTVASNVDIFGNRPAPDRGQPFRCCYG